MVTAFAGESVKSGQASIDAFFVKPVDRFRLVEELAKLFE